MEVAGRNGECCVTLGARSGLVPGIVPHGAAKAGTNSITWALAAEFALEVRVNVVAGD